MPERTYYWDFFGPHAAKTAEHFQHHLDEFLTQHGCPGRTGLATEGGHAAVSCTVGSDWFERLERALRPKRYE